jgi:hypothetical protein
MTDKTNALLTAQPKNSRFESGKTTRTVEFEASVTAANSDAGDKFILAAGLSFADRVAAIRPNSAGTPALTGATDTDLGFFYKNEDGTYVALDADVLWNGVTLASALTSPNLLTTLNASLDASKNIGQLLGLGNDQEPAGGVYLVMTTNNANTAVGPLLLRLAIDIDEATTQ